MSLPKRLRMDRAAYITISARSMGSHPGTATMIGWDMADIVLNSSLSETGQHRSLFGELLQVVIERLRMAGVIRGAVAMKHLDAIASDLFAILAINGLYRPVKRADAEKLYQLGPEPPRHLQWWTIEEYGEVMARRKQERRTPGRDRKQRSRPRRRRLRLVVGARAPGRRTASG